tara:strand:+ start:391 stop:849 length:459 start_codon:yes stop_codon:yes gene_type:complete
MTLKELQKMIKEEFDSYMGEAEDDVDVSVNPDSDVDAEMGDMEDEGSEEMLRKIYDMLKDKFEAEEEDMGDDMDKDMDEDMDENMPMEEDMDEGDSDLDEASSMGYGDAGNKKTSGKDAGYTPAKTTKGSTGYDAGSKALQERFQKLANIIK